MRAPTCWSKYTTPDHLSFFGNCPGWALVVTATYSILYSSWRPSLNLWDAWIDDGTLLGVPWEGTLGDLSCEGTLSMQHHAWMDGTLQYIPFACNITFACDVAKGRRTIIYDGLVTPLFNTFQYLIFLIF